MVIFTSVNHIHWMLVGNIWVAAGAQAARACLSEGGGKEGGGGQ